MFEVMIVSTNGGNFRKRKGDNVDDMKTKMVAGSHIG